MSYTVHIGKMIWPADPSVFYPLRRDIPLWQVLTSAAAILGALAVASVLGSAVVAGERVQALTCLRRLQCAQGRVEQPRHGPGSTGADRGRDRPA